MLIINGSKEKILASNNTASIRIGMAIGFIVTAILVAIS